MAQPGHDVDPPAERVGARRGRCAPRGSRAGWRRGAGAAARGRRAASRRRSGRRPRSAPAGGAGRSSAGTASARRTAPSAPPRRRSRRCARASAPPPARGRPAGCRPSCASRRRRSAPARARSRPGTKSIAYSCACVCGSEAPASLRSLTIRWRQAAPAWKRIRSRQASSATATCSGSRSARETTGCGALTITSWAPVAAWAVNRSGLACALGRPRRRGRARGRGSGTTRTCQPGVSGCEPFGRTAYTSGGVRSSWPSRNGSRLRVDRRRRFEREAGAGPRRARRGDDALQPRQGVDADLRHERTEVAVDVGGQVGARSGSRPGG